MEIKDVAFVGYVGCGYYSESERVKGVLCPKGMVEEVKGSMYSETYFGDLDDKHSEVQADLEVITDTREILKIIKEYGIGEWGIESGFEEAQGMSDDSLNYLKEFNKEFDWIPANLEVRYVLHQPDSNVSDVY
jgi:hypothetical protein